ncbi:hypothetical protein MANES_12G028300v8 [Manihot esculenta]|uniref:Uncharacterized protein n=2 Tax=Manihot esculenta TaxID=3983 RepID=A0ACB7GP63_MANES|nr:hypothetical protein MANES_12G028300v8 [Manihot esculenta]KAG8641737.1 hypothetical protein MANES_12G028300v8 [Manihot esculenta]
MSFSFKAKNCGMAEERDQRLNFTNGDEAELASLYSLDSSLCLYTLEFPCQNLFQTDGKFQHISVHTVTQSSPSPILSCVEKPLKHAHVLPIPVANSDTSSYNQPAASNVLQDIHISARLMDNFLELARENTEKDLETCGVLGAFLTHPSQSCFMSSIDLHTQYSYQVMVPEAFAIVMAPTDSSRSYGIFRLSDPSGMNVLKECQETGFHPHSEPPNGSPIYEHCSNVYTNSNLRFEIFDLR